MKSSREIERHVYEKLGFLARQLHRIAAAILTEESAAFDRLTGLQCGVLEVVNATDAIDQIGVCEILGVDRSTLAGVVDRLEEKQLIERTVNVTDRRSNMLSITPKGRGAIERERTVADTADLRVVEPLAPEDRERFLALLTQIVQAHSKYTGIAPPNASDDGSSAGLPKRRKRQTLTPSK
jgi:DNA-binding MarR family transcriptional regulator